ARAPRATRSRRGGPPTSCSTPSRNSPATPPTSDNRPPAFAGATTRGEDDEPEAQDVVAGDGRGGGLAVHGGPRVRPEHPAQDRDHRPESGHRRDDRRMRAAWHALGGGPHQRRRRDRGA